MLHLSKALKIVAMGCAAHWNSHVRFYSSIHFHRFNGHDSDTGRRNDVLSCNLLIMGHRWIHPIVEV